MLDYISGDHYNNVSLAAFMESRQGMTGPGSPQTGMQMVENRHFDKPPCALDRSRFPADRPLLVIFRRQSKGMRRTILPAKVLHYF